LNCLRYVFLIVFECLNSSTTQSHTGVTLAKAFQTMLEEFGVEEKILALNGDNATTNDKQTASLAHMNNTFEEENRVRCFNHTLQLSATTLIRPFNTGMTKKDIEDDDGADSNNNDNPDLAGFTSEDDDDDIDESDVEQDDISDGVDELDELDAAGKEALLADTAVVRVTVSKVCHAICNLSIKLTLVYSCASLHSQLFGLRPLLFRHGSAPANNTTSRSS
jgi:hypothetical protein